MVENRAIKVLAADYRFWGTLASVLPSTSLIISACSPALATGDSPDRASPNSSRVESWRRRRLGRSNFVNRVAQRHACLGSIFPESRIPPPQPIVDVAARFERIATHEPVGVNRARSVISDHRPVVVEELEHSGSDSREREAIFHTKVYHLENQPSVTWRRNLMVPTSVARESQSSATRVAGRSVQAHTNSIPYRPATSACTRKVMRRRGHHAAEFLKERLEPGG